MLSLSGSPQKLRRLAQALALPPLLFLGLTACEGYRVPALEKLQSAENAGGPESVAEKKVKDPDAPKLDKVESEYERRLKEVEAAEAARGSGGMGMSAASDPSVDLSFLLSMNYKEAKAISAQSMELPNGTQVAADSVEVIKKEKDGQPKRVRAKGKVYLETSGADGAKILCQEAYISDTETILRGKPIMQRGGSVVEGLQENTVFYMLGNRLRVLGLHRLTNANSMISMLPDLGPWTSGPNPLLPALNEGSVPSNVRDEMMKAAEAEAVLQANRSAAMKQPDAPAAPWVKDEALKGGHKSSAAPSSTKPAAPESPAPKEEPKAKRGFFGRGAKTAASPPDASSPKAPDTAAGKQAAPANTKPAPAEAPKPATEPAPAKKSLFGKK